MHSIGTGTKSQSIGGARVALANETGLIITNPAAGNSNTQGAINLGALE